MHHVRFFDFVYIVVYRDRCDFVFFIQIYKKKKKISLGCIYKYYKKKANNLKLFAFNIDKIKKCAYNLNIN